MRVLAMVCGHDASATIINDGEIEIFLKEERYSGVKHDSGSKHIFKKMLDNQLLRNLDYVMINDSPDLDDEVRYLRNQVILEQSPDAKWTSLPREHHLYHAAVSFYNSGFEKSLILVIDAAGGYLGDIDTANTFECETVYVGEYPDKITPLYKKYWTSKRLKNKITKNMKGCEVDLVSIANEISVGNLYNTAALCMGENVDNCGKAMGLSSYGSRIPNLELFSGDYIKKIADYFKDYPVLVDNLKFISDVPFRVEITKENHKFFADYCYEVQRQCSDKVSDIVKKYIDDTGIKKVCISGGYGMNIVNNYNLVTKFPEVEFYFEPVCDDTGLSIGSAMYLYRRFSSDKTLRPIKSTSFHGLNADVRSYGGIGASSDDIANLLAHDKSVAVLYGRSEGGQRALGNRSILFNPLNPNATDIVNKIKMREWYRPFAVMVLEDDVDLYFDNAIPNPFMTVSFPVKSDIISGVTHVDGTCRIQTVGRDHFLYDLLNEFKHLTGYGILLNTSFNLAGKPLVETPKDALNVLDNSSLDFVWFYESKQLFKSSF